MKVKLVIPWQRSIFLLSSSRLTLFLIAVKQKIDRDKKNEAKKGSEVVADETAADLDDEGKVSYLEPHEHV